MSRPSFSLQKRTGRLRVAGTLTLLLGIAGACLFYWHKTGPAEPRLEDLLPRYEREETRDIGIQMGTFGVVLLRWQQTLERPAVQAGLLAAASALFAVGFFRAARIEDEGERDGGGADGGGAT